MNLNWQKNAEIAVRVERGEVVLSANRDGLLTLSEHLRTLAEELPGSHIHYDAYNGLSDDSTDLIVARTSD